MTEPNNITRYEVFAVIAITCYFIYAFGEIIYEICLDVWESYIYIMKTLMNQKIIVSLAFAFIIISIIIFNISSNDTPVNNTSVGIKSNIKEYDRENIEQSMMDDMLERHEHLQKVDSVKKSVKKRMIKLQNKKDIYGLTQKEERELYNLTVRNIELSVNYPYSN